LVKDLRVNDMIRVREVRLIGADGSQLGVVPTEEALSSARQTGMDLVEVSPTARPPVCKVLDYGKYKFEQEKRIRESKKRQRLTKLKEIRMQPKIDSHDLDFKSKHIKTFLDQGNKVKVTVRFRGRELAHTEIGRAVLDRVVERTQEYAVLARAAQMEGRFMSLILSPKSRK
jgi:translation initiation factor IF-3